MSGNVIRCANWMFSPSDDAARNLALEEYLFNRRAEWGSVLLFYVNRRALVVGRNQNPWRECDVGAARRANVPVLRRITGGGTVFHDPGNLNYSLILPRKGYRTEDVFAQIIRVLAGLGLAVELRRKTNLYALGRKCSGTAFCFRKDSVIHHGTLLIHANLQDVHRFLRSPVRVSGGHAVASDPAQITNLTEANPTLSVDAVAAALRASFAEDSPLDSAIANSAGVEQMARAYADWGRVFGETSTFRAGLSSPVGEWTAEVAEGIVQRAAVDGVGEIEIVKGRRFDARDWSAALQSASNVADATEGREPFVTWLRTDPF